MGEDLADLSVPGSTRDRRHNLSEPERAILPARSPTLPSFAADGASEVNQLNIHRTDRGHDAEHLRLQLTSAIASFLATCSSVKSEDQSASTRCFLRLLGKKLVDQIGHWFFRSRLSQSSRMDHRPPHPSSHLFSKHSSSSSASARRMGGLSVVRVDTLTGSGSGVWQPR
jgi:hypothetical protein